MIDDEANITVIDFPQMVSTSHPNAESYYQRDIDCIVSWFSKRYNIVPSEKLPSLADVK